MAAITHRSSSAAVLTMIPSASAKRLPWYTKPHVIRVLLVHHRLQERGWRQRRQPGHVHAALHLLHHDGHLLLLSRRARRSPPVPVRRAAPAAARTARCWRPSPYKWVEIQTISTPLHSHERNYMNPLHPKPSPPPHINPTQTFDLIM